MSYYIYKICCDDCPEFVYVGSTKAFRQRKSRHKRDCYNENCKAYNNKLYNTIRNNHGWDNWRMVIIDECGEINTIQARIKEEEWRVKLNANLNMLKCHATEEELKEQKKEYREKNKEAIKEQNKEYYENHKEQFKKYREKNKEEIKEYNKEYYEKNKEAIKERDSKKITCKCGRQTTVTHKARHEKSHIHKKLMEEINKN